MSASDDETPVKPDDEREEDDSRDPDDGYNTHEEFDERMP